MRYHLLLSEDEIYFVCSAIPYEDKINYFKKNPKEFAKIRPGFRVKTISNKEATGLLCQNRNCGFVTYFIENHISTWLAQIEEHYNECVNNGDTKELALLHTLPYCFFAGNIGIYFRLIEEDHTEEFITMLSVAVQKIRADTEKNKSQSKGLELKDLEIERLRAKLECNQAEVEKVKGILRQKSDEAKRLRFKITHLEKLEVDIQVKESEISSLCENIQRQEETISKLLTNLSDAINSRQLLEKQIREELENQHIVEAQEQAALAKPKTPRDIDEFKDFLGFNFESLGVSARSEYYILLKDHLSEILFRGTPIVINRNVGITLVKCLGNTLTGNPHVKMISYKQGMSNEEVEKFMLSAGRIICLDNFIGNYNETELLPLFDKYKGQIIFLTVAYDRTLRYVSKEFLRYCEYLNLNRIAVLPGDPEITEDPSTVEEVDYIPQGISSENRFTKILRDILNEFKFHNSLIEQKCVTVFDEQSLCGAMAFDILPYCVDVLNISPYNCSERFLKYAGDAEGASIKICSRNGMRNE